MISYSYNEQVKPPAPFVHLSVGHPNGQVVAERIPALVDTGADTTLIPTTILERLNVPKKREIQIEVGGGQVIYMPAYYVDVSIRDLGFIRVEVVSSAGESHILLGRDVLNRYRVVLNGPDLSLQIE